MREEYDIKNLNPRSNPYCYPAVFSYKDGEEISVVVPDLDVATSGVNDEDALLSAQELLGCECTDWRRMDPRSPAHRVWISFSLHPTSVSSYWRSICPLFP